MSQGLPPGRSKGQKAPIKSAGEMPSPEKAGSDQAEAREFVKYLLDEKQRHELPIAGTQGPDDRAGPDRKYGWDNRATEMLDEKAMLAARRPGAQYTIDKSDVLNERKQREVQQLIDWDDFLLRHTPVDIPGGLDRLNKLFPGTVKRIDEGLDTKWLTLRKVERLLKFAPESEEDYKILYLLENGELNWAKDALTNMFNQGEMRRTREELLTPQNWVANMMQFFPGAHFTPTPLTIRDIARGTDGRPREQQRFSDLRNDFLKNPNRNNRMALGAYVQPDEEYADVQ